MKKTKAGKNKSSEKELKKRRLFAKDEEYEEDEYEDDDDDDEEEDEEYDDEDEIDDEDEEYEDDDDDEEEIDDDDEEDYEPDNKSVKRARPLRLPMPYPVLPSRKVWMPPRNFHRPLRSRPETRSDRSAPYCSKALSTDHHR